MAGYCEHGDESSGSTEVTDPRLTAAASRKGLCAIGIAAAAVVVVVVLMIMVVAAEIK